MVIGSSPVTTFITTTFSKKKLIISEIGSNDVHGHDCYCNFTSIQRFGTLVVDLKMQGKREIKQKLYLFLDINTTAI